MNPNRKEMMRRFSIFTCVLFASLASTAAGASTDYTLSLSGPNSYSVTRSEGDVRNVEYVQTRCDGEVVDVTVIAWGTFESLVGTSSGYNTSGSCEAYVTDKPWLKKPHRLSNTVEFAA